MEHPVSKKAEAVKRERERSKKRQARYRAAGFPARDRVEILGDLPETPSRLGAGFVCDDGGRKTTG
jgi:hypothetical protein